MSIILPSLERAYSGNDQFTLETPEIRLGDQGYTCVIGRNGSGKSSFGEALAEQSKSSGDVKWYYLPQYLERFLFAENIVAQLESLLSQDLELNRLTKLMRDMGVSDPEGFLEFPFLLMSGGERRRMALVCAFYVQPKFLILDEPDIGITAKENMVLLSKINNLQVEKSKVILISHNYEFVKGASDLIGLEGGRVKRAGKFQELLADQKFEIKEYGVRFQ